MTGITKVTLPALSIRRKAFGANGALVDESRTSPRAGIAIPTCSPPPMAVAAVNCRKPRREADAVPLDSNERLFMSRLLHGRGGHASRRHARSQLDRRADT